MLLRKIVIEQLLSTPEGTEFDLRNTPFFYILRANPFLAKFYADFLRRHGANPSLTKDLEIESGFFFDPDQSPETASTQPAKGSDSMPPTQKIRLCTHIKVNGTRCGSPALREEIFCYFHQRMIRGVRTPPKSRLHPIALLENKESIQASLMEIVNALLRNHIDVGRARLILRALYVAVKNAPHANFEPFYRDVVTHVPEYPEAPASGPFALATLQAEALAHINTPQEEESETERLDSAFAALADSPQARSAARIKKTARPRSTAPVVAKGNHTPPRLYQ